MTSVSVVIPTRNRRELLQRAIENVLRQEGVDVDLIVVDDASTDDTWEWLQSQSGFRCLRRDERGEKAMARNAGLEILRYRYVMFLDDDDLLRPGALALLARSLDANPSAVGAIGARWDSFVDEGWGRRDAHPRSTQLRSVFDEFLFGWSAVPSQCLFRTSVLRAVGGYDPSSGFVEDRDLWLRVSRTGPAVVVPDVVIDYRVTRDQYRPADIREQRKRVAERAIAALPENEQERARNCRNAAALIDDAESAARSRNFLKAFTSAVRAISASPEIMSHPLIASWSAKRLGRASWRAFVKPPAIARKGNAHPFVSVVICTRDREISICRAVTSVLENSYEPKEILIVDQSSSDATRRTLAALIDSGCIRYERTDASGLSAARNSGMMHSRGEVVAFTDDDCTVASDWLNAIAREFEPDERIGVVFGSVVPSMCDGSAGMIPANIPSRATVIGRVRDRHLIGGMGASVAIKREVWNDIGGFDSELGAGARFRAAEETDFSIRALRRGYFVSESPDVRVVHYGARSRAEERELVASYMVGNGAMYAKHMRSNPFATLALLTNVSVGWLFSRPRIHYSDSPRRLEKLRPFLKGWMQGILNF